MSALRVVATIALAAVLLAAMVAIGPYMPWNNHPPGTSGSADGPGETPGGDVAPDLCEGCGGVPPGDMRRSGFVPGDGAALGGRGEGRDGVHGEGRGDDRDDDDIDDHDADDDIDDDPKDGPGDDDSEDRSGKGDREGRDGKRGKDGKSEGGDRGKGWKEAKDWENQDDDHALERLLGSLVPVDD